MTTHRTQNEWQTRRQPQTTHQAPAHQVRTKARQWDADDWINAAVAATIAFAFTWTTLDVFSCLQAYEAMGAFAAEYNPKCA